MAGSLRYFFQVVEFDNIRKRLVTQWPWSKHLEVGELFGLSSELRMIRMYGHCLNPKNRQPQK